MGRESLRFQVAADAEATFRRALRRLGSSVKPAGGRS